MADVAQGHVLRGRVGVVVAGRVVTEQVAGDLDRARCTARAESTTNATDFRTSCPAPSTTLHSTTLGPSRSRELASVRVWRSTMAPTAES
jgi:hypothetical protein